jgi:hypothetical protein
LHGRAYLHLACEIFDLDRAGSESAAEDSLRGWRLFGRADAAVGVFCKVVPSREKSWRGSPIGRSSRWASRSRGSFGTTLRRRRGRISRLANCLDPMECIGSRRNCLDDRPTAVENSNGVVPCLAVAVAVNMATVTVLKAQRGLCLDLVKDCFGRLAADAASCSTRGPGEQLEPAYRRVAPRPSEQSPARCRA